MEADPFAALMADLDAIERRVVGQASPPADAEHPTVSPFEILLLASGATSKATATSVGEADATTPSDQGGGVGCRRRFQHPSVGSTAVLLAMGGEEGDDAGTLWGIGPKGIERPPQLVPQLVPSRPKASSSSSSSSWQHFKPLREAPRSASISEDDTIEGHGDVHGGQSRDGGGGVGCGVGYLSSGAVVVEVEDKSEGASEELYNFGPAPLGPLESRSAAQEAGRRREREVRSSFPQLALIRTVCTLGSAP
jgi:hypothetical protein